MHDASAEMGRRRGGSRIMGFFMGVLVGIALLYGARFAMVETTFAKPSTFASEAVVDSSLMDDADQYYNLNIAIRYRIGSAEAENPWLIQGLVDEAVLRATPKIADIRTYDSCGSSPLPPLVKYHYRLKEPQQIENVVAGDDFFQITQPLRKADMEILMRELAANPDVEYVKVAIFSKLGLTNPNPRKSYTGDPVDSSSMNDAGRYSRFIIQYRIGSDECKDPSLIQDLFNEAAARAAKEIAISLPSDVPEGGEPLSVSYGFHLAVGADTFGTSWKLSKAGAEILMRELAANPDVVSVKADAEMQAGMGDEGRVYIVDTSLMEDADQYYNLNIAIRYRSGSAEAENPLLIQGLVDKAVLRVTPKIADIRTYDSCEGYEPLPPLVKYRAHLEEGQQMENVVAGDDFFDVTQPLKKADTEILLHELAANPNVEYVKVTHFSKLGLVRPNPQPWRGEPYTGPPMVDTRSMNDAGRYDRFIIQYRSGSDECKDPSSIQGLFNEAAIRAAQKIAISSPSDAPTGGETLSVSYGFRMAVGADVFSTSWKLSKTGAEILMRELAANPDVGYVKVDAVMRAGGGGGVRAAVCLPGECLGGIERWLKPGILVLLANLAYLVTGNMVVVAAAVALIVLSIVWFIWKRKKGGGNPS